MTLRPARAAWRRWLFDIIFGTSTAAGKIFDVALLCLIVLSVAAVALESVEAINAEWGAFLHSAEILFTLIFTVEYLLRLAVVSKPLHYAASFYGIVDLVALLPTYLSLLFHGLETFLVVRVLRLLRVFRIFKLARFMGESEVLKQALIASTHKIAIFICGVLTLVVVIGAFMHLIEGPERGFTSIPVSMYWAIVTLTTVGFGDLTPTTPLGQFFASIVMITGYGIIAVPTGIVTSEISRASLAKRKLFTCSGCGRDIFDEDSRFCKYCGHSLTENA